jgi:hypothetical protein
MKMTGAGASGLANKQLDWPKKYLKVDPLSKTKKNVFVFVFVF